MKENRVHLNHEGESPIGDVRVCENSNTVAEYHQGVVDHQLIRGSFPKKKFKRLKIIKRKKDNKCVCYNITMTKELIYFKSLRNGKCAVKENNA